MCISVLVTSSLITFTHDQVLNLLITVFLLQPLSSKVIYTLTDNCSVMSFPQSNVFLSFGDTVIMTSVSESYDSTAGSFTYFTAYSTIGMHPNDEGNYRCLANITHG